jgi:hypothetical protein
MNCIQILQDSIDTSIDMEFFKNRKESSFAHIFNSNLVLLPLSTFMSNGVENFKSIRLQKSAVKAYPLHDLEVGDGTTSIIIPGRPRGDHDLSSIKYYQKRIRNKLDVPPIWIICKNKKYTLLDGAHRIVASYIENQKFIPAYLLN